MASIHAELPLIPNIDPVSVGYHDGKDLRLDYTLVPRIHTVHSLHFEINEAFSSYCSEMAQAMIRFYAISEGAQS